MKHSVRGALFGGAAMCILYSGSACAAQTVNRSFDVQAQALGSAIIEFSRQAGVLIVVQPQLTANRRSHPVRGSLPTGAALERMLTGTGLRAISNPSGGYRIARVVATEATPTQQSATSVADGTPQPAQTLTDAAPPGSPAGDQDIVVTAQKRSESGLRVPVSLTALSATSIEKRGLVNAADYLRSIPSVSYVDQGPGQNALVIRGVYGQPFFTGPTVGIYFGDIPLAGLSIGGSTDIKLVDIDRIEVLRGPQGTLYGSNSLSGTVKYVPAAPKLGVTDGRGSVGYSGTSKYGGSNYSVEGFVNLPIGQSLALRVAAYKFHNDGFIKNIAGDDSQLQASARYFSTSAQATNRNHVADTDASGVRASLLWTPVDDLRATFIYMHQHDAADDRPFAQRGLGRYQRSVYNFGPIVGNGPAMKINLDIANLTLEYNKPWGSFFSSTAFVDQDYRRLWEIGVFFPLNGFTPAVPQDSITNAHLFTQELRFASSFDGPLQIVGGLFYERSSQPTIQPAFYYGDPTRNPFGVTASGPLYTSDLDRKVSQIAGFGELSYAVTSRLKLTAGLRAFHYKANFFTNLYQSVNPNYIPLSFSTTKAKEGGKTLKGSAEYSLGKDVLLYAKYAEGFRLGRPQDLTATRKLCGIGPDGIIDGVNVSDASLIESDRLNSYEGGLKGRFLGGRASLSVDAYRNNWKNIPISFVPPSCTIQTITLNGGEARANGLEAEGTLRPVDSVVLDFGVGYVDSKLTATSSLGRKGDRVNYTPEWNGHAGAELRFDVRSLSSFVRADYSYFGSYYNGVGETGTKFDAYGMLDLSAGTTFRKYDVRFFVTNVTGVYAITSDSGFPPNGIYLVRPRTVGIKLSRSL